MRQADYSMYLHVFFHNSVVIGVIAQLHPFQTVSVQHVIPGLVLFLVPFLVLVTVTNLTFDLLQWSQSQHLKANLLEILTTVSEDTSYRKDKLTRSTVRDKTQTERNLIKGRFAPLFLIGTVDMDT